MLPVFGSLEAKGTFMSLIAEAAGVKEEDILGHDLFLYNRQQELSGAQMRPSFPVEDWMTFSVPSLP